MLVPTITFDVTDFKTGIAKEFTVLDTDINYGAILAQKATRNIRFKSLFEHEFEKIDQEKPFFIQFAETVEVSLNALPFVKEYNDTADDEMTGMGWDY